MWTYCEIPNLSNHNSYVVHLLIFILRCKGASQTSRQTLSPPFVVWVGLSVCNPGTIKHIVWTGWLFLLWPHNILYRVDSRTLAQQAYDPICQHNIPGRVLPPEINIMLFTCLAPRKNIFKSRLSLDNRVFLSLSIFITVGLGICLFVLSRTSSIKVVFVDAYRLDYTRFAPFEN